MAGYDRAGGVDAELKRIYSSKNVNDIINREALLWGKLSTASEKPKGDGFYMGVLYQGNERGQGAINELESLPTPDKQRIDQCKIVPKEIVHVVRFSGMSLAISEGDSAAFASVLSLGMEGAMKDVPKMMNQMCYRGSAWIARVNGAVTGSTTVTFDGHIARTHIRAGMYVDFYNTDGTTIEVSDVKIISVDYSALTFTTSAAITVTDNCYICRHNEKVNEASSTDATMKALNGVQQIYDDGTTYATYEGIPRTGATAVDAWKGVSIAAGGVDFSDDNMQRVLMRMKINRGSDDTTRIITSEFQRRKYLSLTAPQVTYNTNGGTIARDAGSKKQLYWNDLPIDFDVDAPEDTWIAYTPSKIQKFIVTEPSFENKFNGTVLKWDSGYDGAVAFMRGYLNIGTNDVLACGALTGNAVSTW